MAATRKNKLICLVALVITLACSIVIKYAATIRELAKLPVKQFLLVIGGILLVLSISGGVAVYMMAQMLDNYFEPKQVDK